MQFAQARTYTSMDVYTPTTERLKSHGGDERLTTSSNLSSPLVCISWFAISVGTPVGNIVADCQCTPFESPWEIPPSNLRPALQALVVSVGIDRRRSAWCLKGIDIHSQGQADQASAWWRRPWDIRQRDDLANGHRQVRS